MVRRLAAQLLLLGLGISLFGSAQESHRRPNPTPPSRPADIFDQMERQADGSKQATAAQPAALRREREAALADLSRELDGVIQSATELQSRLKGVDPNTVVSVELRNESKQLEDLAKKIRKQIGSL